MDHENCDTKILHLFSIFKDYNNFWVLDKFWCILKSPSYLVAKYQDLPESQVQGVWWLKRL